MLKLIGSNTLTQNLLKMKGVPYTLENGELFSIETKYLALSDLFTIINYLDERYPVPQLITGDLDNRTRIKQLAIIAINDQHLCDRLAEMAAPFIFSDSITIMDLIVFEKTSNANYREFINMTIAQSSYPTEEL